MKEDLIALGDDIRALDLDVELPSATQAAKDDYGEALEAYDRASHGFDRAKEARGHPRRHGRARSGRSP